MGTLSGKTAIICGGGKDKSIGYGIARSFAQEGCNLVLVGANKGKLKAAKELEELYGAHVLPVFLPNPCEQSISDAVSKAIDEFSRIDVLVNCALVARAALADELSAQDLEETIHACASVPFLWMRECHPHLAKTKGTILNFTSKSAAAGMPALGALAAASGALRALSRVVGSEWKDEGIAVELVNVEAQTAQLEKWASEFPREFAEEMDGASLASVDEVGALCVGLVNDHVASMK